MELRGKVGKTITFLSSLHTKIVLYIIYKWDMNCRYYYYNIVISVILFQKRIFAQIRRVIYFLWCKKRFLATDITLNKTRWHHVVILHAVYGVQFINHIAFSHISYRSLCSLFNIHGDEKNQTKHARSPLVNRSERIRCFRSIWQMK